MNTASSAATGQWKAVDLDLIGASFQEDSECLMLVENGVVIFANPACARLLRFDDIRSLVGQKLSTIFTATRFCEDLESSSAPQHCKNPSCQRSLRCADGSQVDVELRCTSFHRNQRSFLLLALREVHRQELARLLRDNELRFGAIFHEAAIGIGTATLDGRIIETNPALTKMLGYTAEELSGMHASELHPQDFVEDTGLIRELVEGKRSSFQLEKRYRRKDGSTLWGRVTVSLVRDAESQPQFLIAMLEDITARKRAEEQLREAEKMEVIGRLAGGVAHDFNNLLTGILLYCDLLRTGLDPKNRLSQHVEEIRMAGEQGAALTQQLLSIARKHSPVRQPVSVNDVVISTENLLRRLIGEHIELATALGVELAPVLADPAQLRQVILNLALNARDAMPNGGRITVSTHACPLDASNRPGILLTVEDTGCGMDEVTRARLFEPFFTTKKPGQGTGLGLATVQRIVKEAGERIEVTTELGRGTRIDVLLPAIDTHSSASAPPVVSTTGQTILLVDDNASARKSMQRILRNAGYRVLTASTGKRAIRVFAENSGKVDLLIADWMMPALCGHDLANTLRRKNPSLKVLLISGYQDGTPESDGSSYALIRKPFAGNVLIEKIHQVLQSKGDSPCS
jgi:PAS domain S-box-containing protein